MNIRWNFHSRLQIKWWEYFLRAEYVVTIAKYCGWQKCVFKFARRYLAGCLHVLTCSWCVFKMALSGGSVKLLPCTQCMCTSSLPSRCACQTASYLPGDRQHNRQHTTQTYIGLAQNTRSLIIALISNMTPKHHPLSKQAHLKSKRQSYRF